MFMYNFQRFTKTGSKLGNYTISITKNLSLGFNSGFYNKENISRYKKIIFFGDKNEKAIGFQFTNDENATGIFTVVHHQGGSTGSVTARSFFTDFGINKEHTEKYRPEKTEHPTLGTIFVIKLLKTESETKTK